MRSVGKIWAATGFVACAIGFAVLLSQRALAGKSASHSLEAFPYELTALRVTDPQNEGKFVGYAIEARPREKWVQKSGGLNVGAIDIGVSELGVTTGFHPRLPATAYGIMWKEGNEARDSIRVKTRAAIAVAVPRSFRVSNVSQSRDAYSATFTELVNSTEVCKYLLVVDLRSYRCLWQDAAAGSTSAEYVVPQISFDFTDHFTAFRVGMWKRDAKLPKEGAILPAHFWESKPVRFEGEIQVSGSRPLVESHRSRLLSREFSTVVSYEIAD